MVDDVGQGREDGTRIADETVEHAPTACERGREHAAITVHRYPACEVERVLAVAVVCVRGKVLKRAKWAKCALGRRAQ
jgi:hypothetical protein